MNRFIPALVATLVMTGGAYAQSINIGPGGVGVDTRGPRERVIEREVRRDDGDGYDRRSDRGYRRDDRRRAEFRDRERCRTVVTREETRRGVIKTRQRVCS
ncbi:hypothetical protein SAMN05216304_101511 [Bosea sp. OK403]|uniref:hypothetical protein n=1 Tax=Bosea sp. OK403 TaxID=1855286 RepID=UPI0008F38F0A|nr:hypothetical protein [Bosea sp. OK403]SFI03394.1 hypothetical protein SAMN05216304_101511 [Bosea sp. OK403]